MAKTLKIAFTGSAVLTPPYPDDLKPIPGPLTAIMPGARRARRSSLGDMIDAQFAFVSFPYAHLVVNSPDDRDADYKYPDVKDPATGVCFLEREHLRVEPAMNRTELTFDDSPVYGFPTTSSTGAGWIARWEKFADGGEPHIPRDLLHGEWDCVRVEVPEGKVSAGFVSEPIARINFDYGTDPETFPYAQTIVVTLSFDDAATTVTLSSTPLAGSSSDPSRLTFAWYGRNSIELLFGNGSLDSIHNMLRQSIVGHDHAGDFDLEFEVLYDVVECKRDAYDLLPLPQIMSHEILRVPCVSSMVAASSEEASVTAQPQRRRLLGSQQQRPSFQREPGKPRRGRTA